MRDASVLGVIMYFYTGKREVRKILYSSYYGVDQPLVGQSVPDHYGLGVAR